MTRALPPGYAGPHQHERDQGLCARCGDPIHRLAERVNPAWLGTLEAVDAEALNQLYAYITQLATLWWWTHQAMDGAARGNGQEEIRTRQRGGDPTFERLGQQEHADGSWSDPDLADRAAVILRGRCRREAKRLRDAGNRLRRELDAFAIADEENLEAEREQWEQQRMVS